MTTSEWLLVLSTIAGPVLAVQAQKWVERARESKAQKVRVFEMLMATRGARLSPEHVRALNMIDVTFYGKPRFGRPWRSAGDQRVLDTWKEYLDHLSTQVAPDANNEVLFAQREELFVNLLFAMAGTLGFSFDRVALKKSWYSPIAHGELEEKQRALIDAAIEVFSGRKAIRIAPPN